MKRLSAAPRAAQRGYMLLLVLVVLVAMMVSGIAMVRSMDTNQLVAGNLAARSATVHSGDVAIQTAVSWISANATTGALYADATASGYYAEEPPTDPDWASPTTWSVCTTCTTRADAAGNQASYVIHRMCTTAGAPTASGQTCSTANSTGASGTVGSHSNSSYDTPAAPMNFYRITVLVTGPRNTTSITQTFVTL